MYMFSEEIFIRAIDAKAVIAIAHRSALLKDPSIKFTRNIDLKALAATRIS